MFFRELAAGKPFPLRYSMNVAGIVHAACHKLLFRHLIQQQTTGERIPEELKRTKEDIAREAQCDVHTKEVLPKNSSVLVLAAMVNNGTFGSNTRLLMTCATQRSI